MKFPVQRCLERTAQRLHNLQHEEIIRTQTQQYSRAESNARLATWDVSYGGSHKSKGGPTVKHPPTTHEWRSPTLANCSKPSVGFGHRGNRVTPAGTVCCKRVASQHAENRKTNGTTR